MGEWGKWPKWPRFCPKWVKWSIEGVLRGLYENRAKFGPFGPVLH